MNKTYIFTDNFLDFDEGQQKPEITFYNSEGFSCVNALQHSAFVIMKSLPTLSAGHHFNLPHSCTGSTLLYFLMIFIHIKCCSGIRNERGMVIGKDRGTGWESSQLSTWSGSWSNSMTCNAVEVFDNCHREIWMQVLMVDHYLVVLLVEVLIVVCSCR